MKESLGEKYINSIIDQRKKQTSEYASISKCSEVIDEAIYFLDLSDNPVPQESLEYEYPDEDDPMLDDFNKNIGV